jgi:Na+-transporting methylmalonyl-CoA/oxaloacetate decarboxylase gamma subunit
MQHAIALVIALAAVIVIFLAARAARKNWRPPSRRSSRKPAATPGGELVAVIAAAVAAASGMAADSFKVVGVEASPAKSVQPSLACGFNTPPWGHVDRFARREGL